MKIKICGCCKKEFPATLEYFYKKVTKAGTIDRYGYVLKKDCISLKSICKTCNSKKTVLHKHKQRAKELNIPLEEYQKNAEKIGRAQTRMKKFKYLELKDLPSKERAKKVRMLNKGYTIEDFKNWDVVVKEKIKKKCIKSRKYDYSEYEDMYPLKRPLLNKKYRELNVPSMIALNMSISVKHLTPELLELGIKSVNLTRQIKSLIKN